MKKLKWYEVLAIVLLVLVATIALMSCTKEQEMIQTPEPYLTHDKTVKFSGQKKVGEQIKFWVDKDAMFPFVNGLQWYFDYGHSTNWKAGSDTIYYTFEKAGLYYVNVVGWNGVPFQAGSKQGLGNSAKMQILD